MDSKKVLFMFPGVGSQFTGMGKDFYEKYETVRRTFEEASDILKKDLMKICFSPDHKEELFKLENSQQTILMLSVAFFRLFKQEIGIAPDFHVGHSLGEYSALCCADVISFSDALEIVKHRGEIINEVSSNLDGTMAWVINLNLAKVEQICSEMSEKGLEVYISAYDGTEQSSISGKLDDIMKIARVLEKEGAIVYPLRFSGPFHCPMMEIASRKMRSILKQYSFNEPNSKIIANYNALPYPSSSAVIDNLSLQLINPIRWTQSINYCKDQGVEFAFELGPKNVLKFLIKNNSPSITSYTFESQKDIENVKEDLFVPSSDYISLIGRCLGVAVSTKNRSINKTNDWYELMVVQPYNQILNIYKSFEDKTKLPTKEKVIESLDLLDSILRGKNVSQNERTAKIKKVLNNRYRL